MHFKARLVAGQTLSGLAFGFWLATAGIYFIDKELELWMVGLILGLVPVVIAALEVPFGILAELLLVSVLAGVAIAAIYLFWQPCLGEIAPDISYAIFGWMMT